MSPMNSMQFFEADDDETQELSNPLDNMFTEEDGSEERTTIESQEVIKTLDPKGLWFTHHSVSRTITYIIQNYYDGPYTCWKNAKVHAKERWWHEFQHINNWDAKYTETVKFEFMKKAAERLRDIASRAGNTPGSKIIPWMTQDVRQMLKKVRSTASFKKRSQQARANRSEGEKKGTKHSQGSISAAEILRREMATNGRMLSAPELFLKTHTKKDKTFTTDQVGKLWADFLSEKEKASNEASGSSNAICAENDQFFKAVGGWKKNGRVYGLGNSVATYYQKQLKNPVSGSSSANTPGIVSFLEEKLESATSELVQTQDKLSDALKKIDEFEKQATESKKLMLEFQENMNIMSQVLKGRGWSKFSTSI